jgi:hypothetical protein
MIYQTKQHDSPENRISTLMHFYRCVGNVLMISVKASFPESMGVLSTGIIEK